MHFDFSPADDPEIPCEVRLWEGRSVTVFVHPRYWKSISIWKGVPLVVSSCGQTFSCVIANVGEPYRMSLSIDLSPSVFGVPTPGDFPGSARIDWPLAIPDLLRTGLEGSPELMDAWKSLSCGEMRSRLSHILLARRPGVIAERELLLLRQLGG